MLNVEKARLDRVYGNDKLTPMITAFGAGFGDDFDLAKLRYGKIILMADADVDGSHIRTLLQVTMEDAAAADETFALLMGEKVEPRREFIERNAKYVMNLDV